MYDLAVVGFGATGVSFLRQLHSHIYEQDMGPVSVALISPTDSFSSGLAFGQAESFHKVNTPPELMGIEPEDPKGFASWLRQRTGKEERYPARLTYSQYLKEVYGSMSLGKRDRLCIEEYLDTAVDIDTSSGNPVVFLDGGGKVHARRVVLALGAVTSPTFSANTGLQPILPSSISDISAPEVALVAGTGLTAVDCVRSLVKKDCQSIHWFSRSGYVPTVISRQAKYEPVAFTWGGIKSELNKRERGERLSRIVSLLRREVACMRNPELIRADELRSKGDLCGYWNYLIERADKSDLPFQDTLFSTRYYAHKIWLKLSEEECLEFQKSFGAFWACWRHPIPMEVVEELNVYAKEGRLQLHRPVTPIKIKGGKYILETSRQTICADALIDGTGGTSDVRDVNSPLIRNLLARGLATAHPCGGLKVDGLTYGLKSNLSNSGIYCLGPLAKGSLFST